MKRKLLKNALGGAIAVLAGLCGGAFAQDPLAPDQAVVGEAETLPVVETVATPDGETSIPGLSKADVDAWLDGFMPYALQSGDVVGATVTIVADGEILTSRGFGYADVENGVPVDGETTIFRPGSVSKLFTWTAIMQLVEQGKVDLDAPVSDYIDFEIPNNFDTPITVRHLMTHTAGFEEVIKDLIILDEEDLMSLEDYLKGTIPSVIFEPGTTPAYSNYATGLAGYIIERVSGLSFEDYIAQNIFEPLGMVRSTFAMPLLEKFEADMSAGYKNAADGEAQYYEMIPAGPAGSLASSGEDMGRFMIAHLADGGPLLQPETARMMHETIDQHTVPLNAMALGFYQQDIRGLRSIGHAGDTNFFHSNLALFLDRNVGIFVSVNSSGKGASPIRLEVVNEFAKRYFPESHGEIGPRLDTAKEHSAQLAGLYESSRISKTSFASVIYFFGQMSIAVNEEGDLVFPFMDGMSTWREVEPFVWQRVGSYERLAPVFDESGALEHIAFEFVSPFMQVHPVPGWRASTWLMPVALAALGLLVLTLVLWPVRAIVRWRYGATFPLTGTVARTHRFARFGVILVMAWVLLWTWTIATFAANLTSLGDFFGTQLLIAQAGQFLLYAGLALALWNTAVVWTSKSSWFAKLWSTVLPLCILMLIWFAAANQLLSFKGTF